MVAKILSTAVVVAVFSAGAAMAQAGRVPAEMPPASYTATQYVDSAGCVFIRAGFNGATTWVPRYGDDRRPMCGVAGGGAVQAAAPAPVTVRPVVVASARPAAPVVSQSVVTVQTGGRVPYSVAPEITRRTVRTQPAPQAQIYQAQAGTLDTRWSFYDQTGPSPCANYSPHSQMYAVPSPAMPELPLRCRAQTQHPADALRELSPRGGVWEPWNGVSPYPAPNNNVYMLPPPFAPRWPQPYLQGASAPRGQAPAGVAPRATVSTMGTVQGVSAAAAPTSGRMSNGQYVQVGTFGVASNAQATVARLQSRGMPVATSRATAGGQAVQVVLAGPFASQAELASALGAARALGYSDAFVR